MKIKGKTLSEPNIEVVVFPRSNGNIVFKAQAVLDYSEFDALCPCPLPPTVLLPGGEERKEVKDPEYNDNLSKWAAQKTAWMVLESLKATDDLEWETIVPNDPSTWENWSKELLDAKFSEAERGRIFNAVITACGLNQSKIDEATESFLAEAGRAQDDVASPNIEQLNMPSGVLAKDSK